MEITIEAGDLPWAWRSAENRLVVSAGSSVGRGHRLAIKVSGVAGETDPMIGTVATAHMSGEVCIAEVELDEDGRALVKRILAFLRGEAAGPRARAPRRRLVVPAVVNSAAGTAYMKTCSVSLSGCGLAWSGPPPPVGGGLYVRLGPTARSAGFRAKVCWIREGPGGLRVGLRFLAGQEAKLAALLLEDGTGAAAP